MTDKKLVLITYKTVVDIQEQSDNWELLAIVRVHELPEMLPEIHKMLNRRTTSLLNHVSADFIGVSKDTLEELSADLELLNRWWPNSKFNSTARDDVHQEALIPATVSLSNNSHILAIATHVDMYNERSVTKVYECRPRLLADLSEIEKTMMLHQKMQRNINDFIRGHPYVNNNESNV